MADPRFLPPLSTVEQKRKYKIPKEIHVIKNKDKSQNEHWTIERKKSPANWPCPNRFILVGRPNTGKTLILQNILLQTRPLFEKLVLVHPDGQISREWEALEPSYVMESPPGADFFESLLKPDGTFPKTAIVIDDIELYKGNKEILARIASIMRYYSTHRYITSFLTFQSWFDIPSIFRKLASVFILWRPLVSNEITMTENRLGLKKGMLKYLFDTFCPNHRDFLVIDHSQDTPMPLRKGLFTAIVIDSDSEDEDAPPIKSDDDFE